MLGRPALAGALLAVAATTVACSHEAPPPAAVRAETAAPPAPSAASTASTAAPAEGVLLEWKAKKRGAGTKVHVTLMVGEREVDLGDVDATSDDEGSGTPAACSIFGQENTRTSSRFGCGGTPAYHFFTASLRGGALVVTSTQGVDGERGSETVKEVARVPASGAALVLRPFAPKP